MTATLQQNCRKYLATRTSSYEQRCERYENAYQRLIAMGFSNRDSLVDVGAGRCELEGFLRAKGWYGEYTAVDGSLDGSDLNVWFPTQPADWFVALEVVEHVHDPRRLCDTMEVWAEKGVFISTPNHLTLGRSGVLNCDPTHVSVLYVGTIQEMGWEYDEVSLFGKQNDSLIAWMKV